VKTDLTTSSATSALELVSVPCDGSSSDADRVGGDVLALFDQFAPALLHYVSALGVDAADAEDVVQETFMALFKHVCLGRDQTHVRAWLFRVAHNLALTRLRTIRRRPAHDAWTDDLPGQPIDPTHDPETQLVADERRQRLRAVVRALPTRDRRCLLLRAEGLTYRDIASTLRLSLGGVAKALTRATTRLMSADGG
jgi:RNA polymerase sigma-70 factor (ECF subfamily)